MIAVEQYLISVSKDDIPQCGDTISIDDSAVYDLSPGCKSGFLLRSSLPGRTVKKVMHTAP